MNFAVLLNGKAILILQLKNYGNYVYFYIRILLPAWKMFTVFVEKACLAWYTLMHAKYFTSMFINTENY